MLPDPAQVRSESAQLRSISARSGRTRPGRLPPSQRIPDKPPQTCTTSRAAKTPLRSSTSSGGEGPARLMIAAWRVYIVACRVTKFDNRLICVYTHTRAYVMYVHVNVDMTVNVNLNVHVWTHVGVRLHVPVCVRVIVR